MKSCIQAEHLAIKERVEFFMLETTGHQRWAGLLTGQCKECQSTLALQLCLVCSEPCASVDALPWGNPEDERVGHFACIARTMLEGRKVGKFVILVGKGTAREFVRNDNTEVA